MMQLKAAQKLNTTDSVNCEVMIPLEVMLRRKAAGRGRSGYVCNTVESKWKKWVSFRGWVHKGQA